MRKTNAATDERTDGRWAQKLKLNVKYNFQGNGISYSQLAIYEVRSVHRAHRHRHTHTGTVRSRVPKRRA